MKTPLSRLYIAVLFSFLFSDSMAQVAQKVVVEHFTNTRCGICASRNPGLFTNLDQNPEILHIAYHPSSPYSSCVLNQHNKLDNDDRTKEYGIYGATPRIVIQGKVISASTNFASGSLFNAYLNKTTAFAIDADIELTHTDSITTRIAIHAVDTHSFSSLRLYVLAVEDTVFYNAPNGENEHFDVMRKVLIDQTINNLPNSVGDSVIVSWTSAVDEDWNLNRIYAIAMMQDAQRNMIQVEASDLLEVQQTARMNQMSNLLDVEVYPNPFSNKLIVKVLNAEQTTITLRDALGRVVYEEAGDSYNRINFSDISQGHYTLELNSSAGLFIKKLIKY